MIPKIIHQQAPEDEATWHPIWNPCQQSWKKNYRDFEYYFWTDEKIDKFVQEFFPSYWKLFNSCPVQIIKIDIVRYMILYVYGGIYADMDMYCYKNFYDLLNKPVCLIEARHDDEVFQNSLMVSEKQNLFFQNCIEISMQRLNDADKNRIAQPDISISEHDINISNYFVRYISGPILLSDVYNSYDKKEEIQSLDKELFHPDVMSYSEKLYTKHMLSGRWGNHVFEVLKERAKSLDSSTHLENYVKKQYSDSRLWGMNIDNFDFEKNYFE